MSEPTITVPTVSGSDMAMMNIGNNKELTNLVFSRCVGSWLLYTQLRIIPVLIHYLDP